MGVWVLEMQTHTQMHANTRTHTHTMILLETGNDLNNYEKVCG